jgi:hypothetical protein
LIYINHTKWKGLAILTTSVRIWTFEFLFPRRFFRSLSVSFTCLHIQRCLYQCFMKYNPWQITCYMIILQKNHKSQNIKQTTPAIQLTNKEVKHWTMSEVPLIRHMIHQQFNNIKSSQVAIKQRYFKVVLTNLRKLLIASIFKYE